MNFKLHDTSADPFEAEETDVLTDEQFPYNLIVWNDDVNTFDWVIETLVEVWTYTGTGRAMFTHHSLQRKMRCKERRL